MRLYTSAVAAVVLGWLATLTVSILASIAYAVKIGICLVRIGDKWAIIVTVGKTIIIRIVIVAFGDTVAIWVQFIARRAFTF